MSNQPTCPHGKASREACDVCSERGIWAGITEGENYWNTRCRAVAPRRRCTREKGHDGLHKSGARGVPWADRPADT